MKLTHLLVYVCMLTCCACNGFPHKSRHPAFVGPPQFTNLSKHAADLIGNAESKEIEQAVDQKEDPSALEGAYNQILSLNSQLDGAGAFIYAYAMRGALRLHTGSREAGISDLKSAIDLCDRELQKTPDDVALLYYCAYASQKHGDRTVAVEMINRASKLSPGEDTTISKLKNEIEGSQG